VRLTRVGVPLGRRLRAADFVTVRWTVQVPDDVLVGRRAAGRRHVLARLLVEAANQGAAPTDADLAAALGVSRRTILRDMASLRAVGTPVPTRRRRPA
jgi:hypothetical protein